MAHLRFACLGSGSRGNSWVIQAVESGQTSTVVLDCGFKVRELERRLSRLGVSGNEISALLITHEHGDHSGGAASLISRYPMSLWTSHGTWNAVRSGFDNLFTAGNHRSPPEHLHSIVSEEKFCVGDLQIMGFEVSHDANESLHFVFEAGGMRLGILTDTGCSTGTIERVLSGCHALAVEFNHDARMLSQGPYPESLKERVGGDQGHLSNAQASDLVVSVWHPELQHIIASHLSAKNNTPALAETAMVESLSKVASTRGIGLPSTELHIADQDRGLEWLELRG